MKSLLIICLSSLFFGVYPELEDVGFQGIYELNSISARADFWPEWHLPDSFFRGTQSQDLFYPNWFEGVWQVESSDLKDSESLALNHLAKFYLNQNGLIVADRSFNAKSIGDQLLGDDLIDVKDDPKSANRQLAFFLNGEYLETSVMGRKQIDNGNEFFSDELVLQILHSSNQTRIKRVETLSKYWRCNEIQNTSHFYSTNQICGEQWQALYPEPGIPFKSFPLKTNHYRIILKPFR